MTDDRQRARDMAAAEFGASWNGLNLGKAFIDRVADLMLAFATPSTPEAGVEIPAGDDALELGAVDMLRQMQEFEATYRCSDHTKNGFAAGRLRYLDVEVDKMYSAWLAARAPRAKPTPADIPTNDDALREAERLRQVLQRIADGKWYMNECRGIARDALEYQPIKQIDPAAAKPIPALREALVDVVTHRSAWRDAIILARDEASEGSEDPDADRCYWNHELRAFDRTFAALSTPSTAARPDVVRQS